MTIFQEIIQERREKIRKGGLFKEVFIPLDRWNECRTLYLFMSKEPYMPCASEAITKESCYIMGARVFIGRVKGGGFSI